MGLQCSAKLLDTLGDVIATRELIVRTEPRRKVVVMMGKPQLWRAALIICAPY